MENNNILTAGTLLHGGRLRVEEHLGSGGFGNTYRVTEVSSGRAYALKEFYLKGVNQRDTLTSQVRVSNPDNTSEFETQKDKFGKEANRLSSISHPNVVRVYDLFEENGTAYYVMDYLEGSSLAAQMKAQGHSFTENEVLPIASQLLDALGAVHAQNIWHLDLKPGNVMTAADGRVVLIDFGASKQFRDNEGHSLSTSTGLCYTPGYAPTEQIAVETNRIGPWTDLYALGATLFNLLTMQTPPSVSAIQDGDAFIFPPTVSPDMQTLIRWLMEPNRKLRPQSVFDVRAFMDAHFLARPTAAPGPQPVAVPPTPYVASPASISVPPPAPAPANDDGEDYYTDDDEEPRGRNKLVYGGVGVGVLVALLAMVLIFIKTCEKRPAMSDDLDEAYVDSIEWAEEVEDLIADSIAYMEEMVLEEPVPVTEAPRREQADDSRWDIPDTRTDTRERQPHSTNSEEGFIADIPEAGDRKVQVREEEEEPRREDNIVFEVVEQMPQYPGGDAALMQYLSTHIKYPAVAEANGIQGRVVCSFVVEKDGSITNMKVVKSVDPSLDKEAVRVLSSMPRWVPGKQNGAAMRVRYTVPVTFRLQ